MFGREIANRIREFPDPCTGLRVRQLTSSNCHSNHLYFTHSGWHAGGTRLVIASDRGGSGNLYSIDLAGGDLHQLTAYDDGVSRMFSYAMVVPGQERLTVLEGDELRLLDLDDGGEETVWRVPVGWVCSGYCPAADGRSVYLGLNTDVSDRLDLSRLGEGYVGFVERFQMRVPGRVVRLDLGSGAAVDLWQEDAWIGHINASPVDPELVGFCHEGPWDRVDHRIWTLRVGEPARRRGRSGDGIFRGHEYWHADGLGIGYHSWEFDGPSRIGHIDLRDDSVVEVPVPGADQPGRPMHIFSLGRDQVVSDFHRDLLQIWQWQDGGYHARPLAVHRGSFHVQRVHIHARFTPAGDQVLFCSDRTGYGQVYLVDFPGFEALPSEASAAAYRHG